MTVKRKGMTDAEVRKLDAPGRYYVAEGYFVRISPNGRKTWLHKLGKTRFVTLGNVDELATLAAAKRRRDELLVTGELTKNAPTPLDRISFAEAAEQYLTLAKNGWKIPEDRTVSKTEQRWNNIIEQYIVPVLKDRPVLSLTPRDCAEVLRPLWHDKHPTALKARQYMEKVILSVSAQANRSDNPAASALMNAILSPYKHKAEHHRAPDPDDLRKLLKGLRYSHVSHWAIRWLAASVTRTSTARFAHTDQVNDLTQSWDVPPQYTKMGDLFRVPITDPMREILESADEGWLFASTSGKPISDNALYQFTQKRGLDWTPHGIRSTFRTWAQDQGVEWKIAEVCIDHRKRNDEVESPYARSDMLEVRRPIMEKWANEVLI